MSKSKSFSQVTTEIGNLAVVKVRSRFRGHQTIYLPKDGSVINRSRGSLNSTQNTIDDNSLICFEVLFIDGKKMLRLQQTGKLLRVTNNLGRILIESAMVPVTHIQGELALELPKYQTSTIGVFKYSELQFQIVDPPEYNFDWNEAYGMVQEEFASFAKAAYGQTCLSTTYQDYDWSNHVENIRSSITPDSNDAEFVRSSNRRKLSPKIC
jgi:hypothetical protein